MPKVKWCITAPRLCPRTLRTKCYRFSSWISWPVKLGPIGCLETSVINYHSTLRNTQEERRSYLQLDRSLKSRKPSFSGYPETSVMNYHSTLHNIQEEGRSQLQLGGSLKSRIPLSFDMRTRASPERFPCIKEWKAIGLSYYCTPAIIVRDINLLKAEAPTHWHQQLERLEALYRRWESSDCTETENSLSRS